ncbi:hypothetical protein POTOM_007830 [Populus tomentosa]|uniref:Pentatricopeptide repeat-containing protein n=1 Tax=Populus tomentosa TaxID=118781 RepID=A0A8X8ABC8_POPTO|nr:hypothetical protein POTOM_007830 [Populus tomentosa]
MGTFLDGEALVLFREAIKDGAVPNSKAFVCVLNLCSGRLDFELERQVHARVVKGDWRNYIVDSAIVYFYVQCGDLKSAFCVFDRMVEQDVVFWTTSFTTSGVSKAFGEEKALKFERQIHGFFKSVQWDEEEEHGYMDVHYSTVCGSIGALLAGRKVRAQIFKNCSQSNEYVGNPLVWLYCKCWGLGHESEALGFLKEMMEEGVEPNSFTYSSALKACANLETVRQGKLIHSNFANKTPAPSNVLAGGALIHMFAKCGFVSEESQIFDSILERNLVTLRAISSNQTPFFLLLTGRSCIWKEDNRSTSQCPVVLLHVSRPFNFLDYVSFLPVYCI